MANGEQPETATSDQPNRLMRQLCVQVLTCRTTHVFLTHASLTMYINPHQDDGHVSASQGKSRRGHETSFARGKVFDTVLLLPHTPQYPVIYCTDVDANARYVQMRVRGHARPHAYAFSANVKVLKKPIKWEASGKAPDGKSCVSLARAQVRHVAVRKVVRGQVSYERVFLFPFVCAVSAVILLT